MGPARLRKKECWASFANSLQHSRSVREAARLSWGRQEYLAPAGALPFSAPGQKIRRKAEAYRHIVEVDDNFLSLENPRGECALPRRARKRGGKAKKPGLPDEQTPVLIAPGRHGDQVDAVLLKSHGGGGWELRLMACWPRTMCCCALDGDTAVIALCEKARHPVRETILSPTRASMCT